MSKPWWNVKGKGGHLLVVDPFEVWVGATQNVRGNYDWALTVEDAFSCRTAVEQGEAGTHAAAVKAALTSANVELGRMARASRSALRRLGHDTVAQAAGEWERVTDDPPRWLRMHRHGYAVVFDTGAWWVEHGHYTAGEGRAETVDDAKRAADAVIASGVEE